MYPRSLSHIARQLTLIYINQQVISVPPKTLCLIRVPPPPPLPTTSYSHFPRFLLANLLLFPPFDYFTTPYSLERLYGAPEKSY